MEEPVAIEVVCAKCSHVMDAAGEVCPKCGAAGKVKKDSILTGGLLENRWIIVGLMVFAALFLGLPFLWRSRQFSLLEKTFWTVFVLLETALLFWFVYLAFAHLFDTLRKYSFI